MERVEWMQYKPNRDMIESMRVSMWVCVWLTDGLPLCITLSLPPLSLSLSLALYGRGYRGNVTFLLNFSFNFVSAYLLCDGIDLF